MMKGIVAYCPHDPQGDGLARAFYHLRHPGAVANVVVCKGRTGVHGSATTLIDQRDLIGGVWKSVKPGGYTVVTSGPLYVHFQEYLRFDYNLNFLREKHFQEPVGPTSLGKEHFPVPPSLAEFYQRLNLDDGFLTVPKLDGAFPSDPVLAKDINTKAGRLEYWARDTQTNDRIKNPMEENRKTIDAFLNEWNDRQLSENPNVATNFSMNAEMEEFARRGMVPIAQKDGSIRVAQHRMTSSDIRSSHSYSAGALAMGNQANERAAVVTLVDGMVIHFALTVAEDPVTKRRNGWIFNETYQFIDSMLDYLAIGYDHVKDICITDGGPSTLIAILGGDDQGSDGPRMANLIAKGGQEANLPPRWLGSREWRKANMLVTTTC